jgi:hypothetical protein
MNYEKIRGEFHREDAKGAKEFKIHLRVLGAFAVESIFS